MRVNAVCRDVERAKFLRPMGTVGQVTPMRADITDPDAVARAVSGADVVINLVGILHPSGRNTFEAVQATAPGTIAKAASAAGAKAFVHVSAIGADPDSASAYARSKAAGEAAVLAAFPAATILRPSIVFGPDDSFFNRFASMAQMAPALPLFGGGATKFQPVYVDDVAAAALAAIDRVDAAGGTYELGGPSVYTFRRLLEMMLLEIRRKRALVAVPFPVASAMAAVVRAAAVAAGDPRPGRAAEARQRGRRRRADARRPRHRGDAAGDRPARLHGQVQGRRPLRRRPGAGLTGGRLPRSGQPK